MVEEMPEPASTPEGDRPIEKPVAKKAAKSAAAAAPIGKPTTTAEKIAACRRLDAKS
jgi:hypothetical protein